MPQTQQAAVSVSVADHTGEPVEPTGPTSAPAGGDGEAAAVVRSDTGLLLELMTPTGWCRSP
jgi:hypothetical protein